MANRTLEDARAEQGAISVSAGALVPISDQGISRVATVGEIATAVAGLVQVPQPINGLKGAKVVLLNNKSQNGAPLVPSVLLWQDTEYDTDNFWDVAQPDRIVVPNGISKVRLDVSMQFDLGARGLSILKNGSPIPIVSAQTGPNSLYCSVGTGDVNVVAGDYFQAYFTLNSIIYATTATWFKVAATEIF